MIKMSKFPHVEQFRNVIRKVKDTTQYTGKDAEGNAIFNPFIRLPTLNMIGTVKLHGTNAGVGVLWDGTQWAQSRERIITPENDNAGFATFAYKNREIFNGIVGNISRIIDHDIYKGVLIYGEWCGKGIQKGVAISELDKMFVVFAVKLLAIDTEKDANRWFNHEELKYYVPDYDEERIFNIYSFDHFFYDVDFNNPGIASNHFIKITEAVEAECPVARKFMKRFDGMVVDKDNVNLLPPELGSKCLEIIKIEGAITISL